jgi:hypothetical protein
MSGEVVLVLIGLTLGGLVPGFLLARFGYVWLAIGFVVLAVAVTSIYGAMSANANSWASLSYFVISAFGGVVTLASAIGAGLGVWLRRRAAKINSAHPTNL